MQTIFPFDLAPLTHPQTNRLAVQDRAAHDWYRFVLSFPPHLVRDYLQRWGLGQGHTVLDPFCGTGTTLVEAKKMGISSCGVEANPVVCFLARTKTDWAIDAEAFMHRSNKIFDASVNRAVESEEMQRFSDSAMTLLLNDSISPLPLHKVLTLRDLITQHGDSRFAAHQKVALAKIAVSTASNLKFGPEVGVSARRKDDAPVFESWRSAISEIAKDIICLQEYSSTPARVLPGDAREIGSYIPPGTIDAVFTSPPYPNEKDYSRTTRLEMVLLGFADNKLELQQIKRGLLRSNTRGVYKRDDDDQWIEHFPIVLDIARRIENRRRELGKTSGFERLYAQVTKLYFGGLAKHLAGLRPLLRPGAMLGYVVGDQASYLRVLIRTGEILSEIAESLGYTPVSIDLFRTRFSTTTKEMLREEIVVLRWSGKQ